MEHHEVRSIAIIAAMVNPGKPERKLEYISLLNRSINDIDLTGWYITDETNKSINLSGVIKSGLSESILGLDLGKIRLRNKGGALKLFSNEPCLIDHVVWSAKEVRDSKGRAILFK